MSAAPVQIATPAFVAWLKTTKFAGNVQPGEQWDTAEAWPSKASLQAARSCFKAFVTGDKLNAEAFLYQAQEGLV
jgi:hypothetical protein